LRRLHHLQPESFTFTPANQDWAAKQIAKYPQGRQASAVIPLLWRGQEQEGWVSRPMIEAVAKMLDMAEIRVLEVATFYFMFQLQPVGSVAHIQVCGTTSCMICGAEDLIGVCKKKIAARPHELSADGKFSWEEVECLGACSNAPMAQIGKDYYEDLTAQKLEMILDTLADGEVPQPGPQNGRFASEPVKGLTSLKGDRAHDANASISLALAQGDTVARITGGAAPAKARPAKPAKAAPAKKTAPKAKPEPKAVPQAEAMDGPEMLKAARGGKADDLKLIKGVGPKLEGVLNDLGVYHFDQIAAWTEDEVAWVDERLKFKGRIARDGWIAQAKQLAGKG
jgi:NADH-quinone oxidoreductase subunit E